MLVEKLREDEVYCEINGVIRLNELLIKVPGSLFLTTLHIDICCKLAYQNGFTGDSYKVYVNILIRHSVKVKIITALVTLINTNKIKISAINSSFISKDLMKNFVNIDNIDFYNNIQTNDLIDKKHFRRLLAKVIIHKCYRVFFRKIKAESVIRSWVEISKSMYDNEFKFSLILIYPFYLNFKRQIEFIKYCYKNKFDMSLCGIPYSFYDYIKIILSRESKDFYCVNLEINAYNKHADDLLALGVKNIYTSDEFEAGAVVLYDKLSNYSVISFNTAHGMSFGCPFLKYDIFKVYNTSQKHYYSYKSDKIKYIVEPRANIRFKSLVKLDDKYKPVVVFIESNAKNLNMTYEIKLENQIVHLLSKIKTQMGVDIFVKAHPNSKITDFVADLKIINNFDDIKCSKLIFISYLSAAYYDFKHLGSFIFVSDGFMTPEEFYGENNLTSTPVENLGNVLINCLQMQ